MMRARKAGTQRSLLTMLDTIQNVIVTAISEKERNLIYVIIVNSYMGSYAHTYKIMSFETNERTNE